MNHNPHTLVSFGGGKGLVYLIQTKGVGYIGPDVGPLSGN
jgi:hypothetical protein